MTCAEQCKLRQHKSGNDYNFKSYSFTHFVSKTIQHTSVALALNGLWTVVRHRKLQDVTVSLIFFFFKCYVNICLINDCYITTRILIFQDM